MRLPPDGDSVGSWIFSLPITDPGPDALLARLASATAISTEVLTKTQLLVPRELRCEPWLMKGRRHPVNAQLPGLTIRLSRVPNSSWIEDQARNFARDAGFPEAFPQEIVVSGPGKVLHVNGASDWEDSLCVLEALFDGVDVIVALETYSDVWLSHDLRGRPQQEVAERNAPRLGEALRALGKRLGAPVEPSEPSLTKYAIALPDGLENVRDADGEVVPTFDL